jgi:hypothetical protein
MDKNIMFIGGSSTYDEKQDEEKEIKKIDRLSKKKKILNKDKDKQIIYKFLKK